MFSFLFLFSEKKRLDISCETIYIIFYIMALFSLNITYNKIECPLRQFCLVKVHLSRNVRKHTFGHVRPAKTQIRLRIRVVWSESALGAFQKAKDAKFPHADNDEWIYCDRVFAARTCQGTLRFIFLRYGSVSYVKKEVGFPSFAAGL